MRRWFPLLLTLVLLPAGARSEVAAEYALDAGGQSYGSFGSAASVSGRAQVFTVETPGIVSAVWLRVGRSFDHDVDLVVGVYEEANGLPSGEPLVEDTFDAGLVPEGGAGAVTGFAFAASSVELEADTRYVIVAVPAELDPGTSLYFLNGQSADDEAYDGGDSAYQWEGSGWTAGATVWSFRVEVGESTPAREATWGTVKRAFAADR